MNDTVSLIAAVKTALITINKRMKGEGLLRNNFKSNTQILQQKKTSDPTAPLK
jgi:hypothetical protein